MTTLVAIWAAPVEQLAPILATQGYAPSGEINRDRALVALIYYNAGMLPAADAEWVAWPRFFAVMSSTLNLHESMMALRREFVDKILYLHGIVDIATDNIHGLISDVWEDADVKPPEYDAWITPYDGESDATDYNTTHDVTMAVVGDVAGSYIRNAVSDAAYHVVERAGNTITAAGTSFQTYLTAVSTAVWRSALAQSQQIRKAIGSVKITMRPFDPVAIMKRLFATDISRMMPVAQCFWVYSLWDLLQITPHNEELNGLYAALLTQYPCTDTLAEVPMILPSESGLSPLFRQVGTHEVAALSRLIGAYASRPPTRDEVIARLMA